MKNILLIPLVVLALLHPIEAFAKPNVEISITAEKEIVLEENGQQITKKVQAETIEPGDILFYTVSYANNGDEPASGVIINDPIPTGTTYIAGSVTSGGKATSFSIDGGKTFKSPSLLSYEVTNKQGIVEKHIASSEQYTHIRWQVGIIAPGSSGEFGFQVVVK